MKQNEGLTLVALVITIMVLLILAGVSIALTIGNDGILTKASTVELSYNQGEVLEEIKTLTAEKYLAAYNETLGKDLETKYNTEILLRDFLGQEKNVIDYSNPNDEDGYRYYKINLSSLRRKISKYGTGNWENGDVFLIRQTVAEDGTLGNECEVCYKPKTTTSTEITVIGSLDINHPVK